MGITETFLKKIQLITYIYVVGLQAPETGLEGADKLGVDHLGQLGNAATQSVPRTSAIWHRYSTTDRVQCDVGEVADKGLELGQLGGRHILEQGLQLAALLGRHMNGCAAHVRCTSDNGEGRTARTLAQQAGPAGQTGS